MPNSATLHLALSAELKSKLEALARSKNESAPVVAVEAIASYVETYQWHVDEIARGLAEADAGGPFVEHERVVEWLRSWGTDNELPPPRFAGGHSAGTVLISRPIGKGLPLAESVHGRPTN